MLDMNILSGLPYLCMCRAAVSTDPPHHARHHFYCFLHFHADRPRPSQSQPNLSPPPSDAPRGSGPIQRRHGVPLKSLPPKQSSSAPRHPSALAFVATTQPMPKPPLGTKPFIRPIPSMSQAASQPNFPGRGAAKPQGASRAGNGSAPPPVRPGTGLSPNEPHCSGQQQQQQQGDGRFQTGARQQQQQQGGVGRLQQQQQGGGRLPGGVRGAGSLGTGRWADHDEYEDDFVDDEFSEVRICIGLLWLMGVRVAWCV